MYIRGIKPNYWQYIVASKFLLRRRGQAINKKLQEYDNTAVVALYVAYHKIVLDLIEYTGCKRNNDTCG